MPDQYLLDIKEKGEMSQLLAEMSAETLMHDFFGQRIGFDHVRTLVPGKNGINAIRVPQNKLAVVYSVGGDPSERDVRKYCESVIQRIILASRNIGAQVLGISDIIDASRTDRELVSLIGSSLRDAAIKYKTPILNGELANLGKRVNCECNITGTGIGFIPRTSRFAKEVPGVFFENGVYYAVFDPKEKYVIVNSDGIGTKTEFYERAEKYDSGVIDFFAMNLDDCVKLGATPMVISGLLEYNGVVPVESIRERANNVAMRMDILSIMQEEDVGNRIKGYYYSSYNISGSVVSVIDERKLKYLPVPRQGDFLVALRGKPNPRSNGITSKREFMEEHFGKDWYMSDEGKIFLEYLAEPSTIFYPVFRMLIDSGYASSVYHMSGGAFDEKLAKPLSKHGLYVEIGKDAKTGSEELFPPDWREILMSAYSPNPKDVYAKWPMGNEGFFTTSNPSIAIKLVQESGLEARVVGRLEKRADGKTGVKLRAYNSQEVYFSGKAV